MTRQTHDGETTHRFFLDYDIDVVTVIQAAVLHAPSKREERWIL